MQKNLSSEEEEERYGVEEIIWTKRDCACQCQWWLSNLKVLLAESKIKKNVKKSSLSISHTDRLAHTETEPDTEEHSPTTPTTPTTPHHHYTTALSLNYNITNFKRMGKLNS